MAPNSRIVVCGATGMQGGATVKALLQGGRFQVAALVRDPTSSKARGLQALGAQLVHGDMEDRASLEKAFAGAHGVFSVQQPWNADYSGIDIEKEIRQGKIVAQAARAAGVQHIVYSSAIGAGTPTDVPHIDSKTVVEKEVMACGVPYTIIRPVTFFDNWTGGVGAMALKPGKLPGIADIDCPVYYIDSVDIGKFAAAAFHNPQQFHGKAFDIAGDLKTGSELTQSLERVFGQPFEYSVFPLFAMKLFAPEFAAMRIWFEKRLAKIDLAEMRRIVPDLRAADDVWRAMDPRIAEPLRKPPPGCACALM